MTGRKGGGTGRFERFAFELVNPYAYSFIYLFIHRRAHRLASQLSTSPACNLPVMTWKRKKKDKAAKDVPFATTNPREHRTTHA